MPLFCCLLCDPGSTSAPEALEAVARACSPRIERAGDAVLFDVSGLRRVVGPPALIGAEVARLAAARGLAVRVAVAGTMTAACLLAHARSGITMVAAGEEAVALAGLGLGTLGALGTAGPRPRVQGPRKNASRQASLGPVALGLGPDQDLLAILRRWGLRTLGDLAKLPEAEVRTRLGPVGFRLHRAARGLDGTPLVPAAEPAKFSERIELEWPIEGLEPLSFVLGRLCEPLAATLECADRGAVAITTRLRLVTRAMHERTLNLPAPIREARVLRTLILLELESHPPPAAIDVVEIDLGVTPGRIVQGSLLARALPGSDTLATLVARLSALMGETRVGAPALVDSHDERAFTMRSFAPGMEGRRSVGSERAGASEPRERSGATKRAARERVGVPGAKAPDQNLMGETRVGAPALVDSHDERAVAMKAFDPGRKDRVPSAESLVPTAQSFAPVLRRFRLPIAAQVTVEHGAPVHVRPTSPGWLAGRVRTRAGPFRSSGHWWPAFVRAAYFGEAPPTRSKGGTTWARDEWDVEVEGADSPSLYRLARDHATGRWEIEGAFD